MSGAAVGGCIAGLCGGKRKGEKLSENNQYAMDYSKDGGNVTVQPA